MQISQNEDIQNYNTFGLSAKAEHFVRISNVQEARAICLLDFEEKRVLGGGSNILFANNIKGLLIKNEIKGKSLRHFTNKVQITVGGGVNWHEFVLWAVEHDFGGVENLSLIPGTVGASPIQNIGAYGVELKDVFVKCKALNLKTGKSRTFTKKTCAFGYRDSFFKNEGKGKWLIYEVTFTLTKNKHRKNTSYGAIQKTLELKGVSHPTISDISEAVIEIRTSKLPDPKKIGNCGSFFKNPEVEAAFFQKLKSNNPNIPSYPMPSGKIKVPAGWLIEQCGWKGKRVGNTGCYKHQALVLVNHGGAKGKEVSDLAHAIIESVQQKFEIRLTPEVNLW